SADPYMGELSMTRAPRSTKTLRDSLASAMPRASPPTSKPCHAPRPHAGRGSPDLGMRRSSRVPALELFGISIPPRTTAALVRNVRRVDRLLLALVILTIVPECTGQVKRRG